MDAKTLIVPSFRGPWQVNQFELCDHFQICEPSAVPVEMLTIESDGASQTFPVVDGRYVTALFLLYGAGIEKTPNYNLTRQMKSRLPLYYGTDLIIDASRADTEHKTLRLLLGDNVRIQLRLRAGYVLPLFPGRTMQELIEFGWQIRDRFSPKRPAPLISGAVSFFMSQVATRHIEIIESGDPNVWPSEIWMRRVKELAQLLQVDAT